MQHLYLLLDPITYAIRYVGLSNDVQRRLREHCSDTGDWLMRQWVLDLRVHGMKPRLIDLGPSTAEQEASWIKTLRTRCRLLNDRGGDVCWAENRGPRRMEVAAYADLLQRLSGEKPTALRRPRVSWLALRQRNGQKGTTHAGTGPG